MTKKTTKKKVEPTEIKSLSFNEVLAEAQSKPGVSMDELQKILKDIDPKGKLRLGAFRV